MKSETVTERGYSLDYINFVVSRLRRLSPIVVKVLFRLANGPTYTRRLGAFVGTLDISYILDRLEKKGFIKRYPSDLRTFLGPKYPPIPIVINELTEKGKTLVSLLSELAELLPEELPRKPRIIKRSISYQKKAWEFVFDL